MEEKKNEKMMRSQAVEDQLGVLAQEEQALKEALNKLENQKWQLLRESENLRKMQENQDYLNFRNE